MLSSDSEGESTGLEYSDIDEREAAEEDSDVAVSSSVILLPVYSKRKLSLTEIIYL